MAQESPQIALSDSQLEWPKRDWTPSYLPQGRALRIPMGYFSALAPALAICPSCWGSMPETPMAPIILPSTKIGTPPSYGVAPRSPSTRNPIPPPAIASSNPLDGRLNNTAVRALSSATAIDPSWVLSSRCTATTYPPVSTTVITTGQLFFWASASAAAMIFLACSSEIGAP